MRNCAFRGSSTKFCRCGPYRTTCWFRSHFHAFLHGLRARNSVKAVPFPLSGTLFLPPKTMAIAHDSKQFFLDGPAGRLESILWTPAGVEKQSLAAVICHPHPLFGGTM